MSLATDYGNTNQAKFNQDSKFGAGVNSSGMARTTIPFPRYHRASGRGLDGRQHERRLPTLGLRLQWRLRPGNVGLFQYGHVELHTDNCIGCCGAGQSFFVPFSAFSGDQSVFTSTGAIVLRIVPSTEGTTLTLDRFEATPTTLNFGDLPADYNITDISDDGARHVGGDLHLGTTIDLEANGFETTPPTTTTTPTMRMALRSTI